MALIAANAKQASA